jgi:hypothetical protein
MSKIKGHVKATLHGIQQRSAKLKHDIHKGDDVHLHNRQGGGALPLPSQLGWGIRKADRKRVSLFDPFKGG